MAGAVHHPVDVRKRHSYRVDAFDSGEAGPVALVEEGCLRRLRDWPSGAALGLDAVDADPVAWPRVEVVTSHAGADGGIVRAAVAAGAKGIVVAGTGNGTVHEDLESALREAQAAGVRVLRATRCAEGGVVGAPADALPSAGRLSPVKARIELLLELLAARGQA